MGFSQALSGLNSAASNLDVVSNNIANSQTVGFKAAKTQFADVYASAKIGLGVSVSGVVQNFGSGNLDTTGRGLDLAISGEGFFKFEQAGQVIYSRNGQLTLTPDGYLENAQGGRLMGEQQALLIPSGQMAAKATDEVRSVFNLKSSSDVITATPFDPADPDTFNNSTTATVYDSQGNAHQMVVYFIKTANNAWTAQATVDGNPAGGSRNLTFDANGVLTAGATGAPFTYTPTNGAAPLSLSLNLTGTTQSGNDFEQTALTQNGYAAGSLVGITIDKNGNVVGGYSNEQTQTLGTLSIVTFRTPEGLQPVGDNGWVETAASGQPLSGVAGVGRFGSVFAGVLESSNVDLTRELVNLIIAQRNYQANAQSVKAQSDALEQAVNLR